MNHATKQLPCGHSEGGRERGEKMTEKERRDGEKVRKMEQEKGYFIQFDDIRSIVLLLIVSDLIPVTQSGRAAR